MEHTIKYEAGQRLWMQYPRYVYESGNGMEVTVTRVGRKYAYIKTDSHDEYRIEVGQRHVDGKGAYFNNSPGTLWVSKADADAAHALSEEWREFVARLNSNTPQGMTAEKLAQIKALIGT